jgi:hypothetical protein
MSDQYDAPALVNRIFQLESKLSMAREALMNIAKDGKIHSDGTYGIKCVPLEACDCASEYAKSALKGIQ